MEQKKNLTQVYSRMCETDSLSIFFPFFQKMNLKKNLLDPSQPKLEL